VFLNPTPPEKIVIRHPQWPGQLKDLVDVELPGPQEMGHVQLTAGEFVDTLHIS